MSSSHPAIIDFLSVISNMLHSTWPVFCLAAGIGRLFSAVSIFSPALSAEIETFKHEDFTWVGSILVIYSD